MENDAKILVTGGAGFIGSAVARMLIAGGCRAVYILDNFSTGHRAAIPAGCAVIEGDVRRKQDLEGLPAGIEYVFHFAAATSVEESFVKPDFYMQNNVAGTINLLDWCVKKGVRKIAYSSSSAVYGNVGESVTMTEELIPEPINYYAVTKLDGELLIKMARLNSGLSYAILRYFNVFGEGQDCSSPYASVIPKFIYAALGGRDLTVYGTGLQTRDYIHVDDVAAASITAMRKGQGIYNVATGTEYNVLALAGAVLEQIQTKSRVVHLPPVPGDALRDSACNKKIRQLGWDAGKDFRSRLRETIDWYRSRFDRGGLS